MKKSLIVTLIILFTVGGAFGYIKNDNGIKAKKNNINAKVLQSQIRTNDKSFPRYTPAPPINPRVKYYSGKAIVLIYHHISDKPFSGITIKPERFEKDLKMFRENGFNVISMRQVLDSMEGKYKLPDNAIAITFDDGIESYYKYAYPLLVKYRMPSSNYIITYRNEHYNRSKKDFNPLSPREIEEMYASGLVDIQSHTDNSHDLVYINPDLKMGGKLAYRIYDKNTKTYESKEDFIKRIKNDLNVSRDIIYKYTGSYAYALCFPFGHYNKTVTKTAKECGFKYFITTEYGINKENSKSIKVLRVRAGDEKLTSEKLIRNIVQCGKGTKDIKAIKKAH